MKSKYVESLSICIAIIFFMGVLAVLKIYPTRYFFVTLIILVWPLSVYMHNKVVSDKTVLFSFVFWGVCSTALFLCNYMITDNNTWWCIFPIIGMFIWPSYEFFKYVWRNKK